MWRLRSIFLVLRRSFNKNEKKTLCFGWHEHDHSQEKTAGVLSCPMSDHLYSFLEENRGEPQNIGIKYEHNNVSYLI